MPAAATIRQGENDLPFFELYHGALLPVEPRKGDNIVIPSACTPGQEFVFKVRQITYCPNDGATGTVTVFLSFLAGVSPMDVIGKEAVDRGPQKRFSRNWFE
jgi:hypothetical protein